MGAFIGIILMSLMLFYQGIVYEQNIEETVVVENNKEEELNKIYTELDSLMLTRKQNYQNKTEVFSRTCKENYSNILRCQKLQATQKDTVSINPPQVFCDAFYNYIKNKKGLFGRYTINELKNLMLKTSSLELTEGLSNTLIYEERSAANLIKLMSEEELYENYNTFGLNNFTENPEVLVSGVKDDQKSAEVFEYEMRKYNLRRYVDYFKTQNEELSDGDSVRWVKDGDISNEVIFESETAFLGGETANFYYIGEQDDLKSIGIKVFLLEHAGRIIKYRALLLKAKRISPEIDKLLAKEYDSKDGLIAKNVDYYNIYEKYYLRYKALLEILDLDDEYLYITDGSVEISTILDNYKNNVVQFHNSVKDLVQDGVDQTKFTIRVLNFETPYSQPGISLDESEEKSITEKEVCDFESYTKKITY